MSTIIIACDHAYVSGGQAKVAMESAIGLRARNHRVIYFAAVGPANQRMLDAGVEVVCLEQPDMLDDTPARAALRGIWNSAAADQLSQLLAGLDPKDSIIHIHGWAKGLSPSIGRVITRASIPSIYTIHEYFLACPNGAFYNYQTESNCALRPMSPACIVTNCDSRQYSHKGFRVLRHSALLWLAGMPGRLRHFICISRLQRQVLEPYLPRDASVYSISNPISVVDSGNCHAENSDTFLFVGRLSREKGGVIFAEAAARTGVKATFVGNGEEMENIRKVLPSARMAGWLPPDRVIEMMRSARALVFPSLWYECQPLTTFEALGNGVPAIVSDNCAARDSVIHGETGFLFKSGDVTALATALQRLADRDVAARMSQAAYDHYWSDPLTLDRHLDRLEEAYERMRQDPLAKHPVRS